MREPTDWVLGPVKNTRITGSWRGDHGRGMLFRLGSGSGRGCVRGSRPLGRSHRSPARFCRSATRRFVVNIIRPASEVRAPGGERRNSQAHGCSEPGPDSCDAERGSRACVSLGGNRPSEEASDHGSYQGVAAAGLRLPHLGISRPAHRPAWPEGRAGAAAGRLGHGGIVDRTAGSLTGATLVGAGFVSCVRAARRSDRSGRLICGSETVGLSQCGRNQQNRSE